MDTNFINVNNRSLGNTDDFATIGELQRTPAVIPSKGIGHEAVVIEAATAGGTGSAGAFDDLRAQFEEQPCDPAVAAYEAAVREAEETKAHNAKIHEALAEAETRYKHLSALLRRAEDFDQVMPWEELLTLAQNGGSDELKEAATWLLSHKEIYQSLPRKGTFWGGDTNKLVSGFDDRSGIDMKAAMEDLAGIMRTMDDLRKQIRPEKQLPPRPLEEASTSTVATSMSNWSSTGATGTSDFAGSTNSTSAAGAPDIESALSTMAAAMGGIEAELAQATLDAKSDNKEVAAKAEQRAADLARKLQRVTSMMQLLNTALSNIAKLYSEMSMTAVRNMK